MPGHPTLAFVRTGQSACRGYEDAYVAAVAQADHAVVLDGLARLAHRLASGVSRKFRLINLSLAALVAAVVSAFAALLA